MTWSRCLARELGESEIRVNIVAPGVTKTDILKELDENELQNRSTVWWDEDSRSWIKKAENKFSIDVRSSDLTDINTQNYIRAWFQFDLIEKDGLSYSLTFECENCPEGKTPYTVSGKFYFYNVCGKEFRSHIKKSN